MSEDPSVLAFLHGKSEHAKELFRHFVEKFHQLGPVTLRATKTMIAIGAGTKAVYITRLGKDFIDVTFPFDKPYTDNLCFTKIAQVPGTNQFNHHFRMMNKSDVNAEVTRYMKLSLK